MFFLQISQVEEYKFLFYFETRFWGLGSLVLSGITMQEL
jgi:hypothetical protein